MRITRGPCLKSCDSEIGQARKNKCSVIPQIRVVTFMETENSTVGAGGRGPGAGGRGRGQGQGQLMCNGDRLLVCGDGQSSGEDGAGGFATV